MSGGVMIPFMTPRRLALFELRERAWSELNMRARCLAEYASTNTYISASHMQQAKEKYRLARKRYEFAAHSYGIESKVEP